MKTSDLSSALSSASEAAREAGNLMRTNLRRTKKVNAAVQHDIKLDLDVRAQRLITRRLAKRFPDIPVLGEEGVDAASADASARWVVDPIDGTVNYAYGIPHAAVSIALQIREPAAESHAQRHEPRFQTVVGVILDPFVEELWTAIRKHPAKLNGRPIRVSARKLEEAVISLGFAKSGRSMSTMLKAMGLLIRRVRKIRMMGSAALALAYVADGRFDGYVESGVRLWDVAAGGLIVECAGGKFLHRFIEGDDTISLRASNGRIQDSLEAVLGRKLS